jgi:hypothetical protein
MAVPPKAKRFQAKWYIRFASRKRVEIRIWSPVPMGTGVKAGAGLKEAADFPLSRLVWPAILAY